MKGIMKPFSLEEHLKNPERKIVTRDGRDARIICTNFLSNKNVIAEIEKDGYSLSYDENGRNNNFSTPCDLFFATEKKEGWINLFRDPINNEIYCSKVYPTKEKAMNSIGAFYATIKVEWEE